MRPPLVFAITSCDEAGGIAAVNRMLIPTLVELADERGMQLAVLSLQGSSSHRPSDLPARHVFRAFADRRGLFAFELFRWASRRTLFFFERVGLARVLLPLTAARLGRTVIFAHGSENWKSVRLLESWSIRRSELIIANSHFTLRKMRVRFPGLRASACPLGLTSVATSVPAPAADSGCRPVLTACDGQTRAIGDRVLLLVGRLHPAERQKGHDLLIEVLPRLFEKYPDVELVFPGPGDDRPHIQYLARQAGVASSVFVPGFVSTDDLRRLYGHCYAFVMPSQQEGFGLVYVEAMSFGKACVGCADDGAEEVIVDGDTGYVLHDANDQEELLRVLLKLLDNPDLARVMGRNGRDRVCKHFTADRFRARFKPILARAIDRL